MPGHYSDTSTITSGADVLSGPLKLAVDNLDDQLFSLTPPGGGAINFFNMVQNGSFENWEHGITTVPDNWTLAGSGATFIRETSTIKHGLYSGKLTRVGNDCNISQNVYNNYGRSYLNSRVMILGAWVYCAVASVARLRINDGTTTTFSSYHPGTSAWAFLTVTVTTGVSISALNVGLQVDTTNASAYIDGAILVEGGTLYGYSQNTPPFNELPKRSSCMHDEITTAAGSSTVALTILTTQLYNAVWAQSPAALNDSFTQSVWLEAGTYVFTVIGQTSTNRAKIDWTLDKDIVIVAGQDWYSASAVQNVTKSVTVVVPVSGYHLLTGTVSGRNASNTTGYVMTLTTYWFKPVAD